MRTAGMSGSFTFQSLDLNLNYSTELKLIFKICDSGCSVVDLLMLGNPTQVHVFPKRAREEGCLANTFVICGIIVSENIKNRRKRN